MLTEICQELRNWFDISRHSGTFTIENGNIDADFLHSGQYFRIMGSIFNDGVHRYPAEDLTDETFTGAVWALAIPAPVIALDEDISAWCEKNMSPDSAAMSPFNSESFGGYSYSKSGSSAGGGADVSWQGIFRSRLNMWRKLI